jgi:hypothetical protein
MSVSSLRVLGSRVVVIEIKSEVKSQIEEVKPNAGPSLRSG